jgi:transcriptional regulator with XRE-family HTH domain
MSTKSAKKIENFLDRMGRERGDRLKSERVRLGFGLSEFAARAGVHRNSQRNYEKGIREPDEEYCNAISAIGVDLLFVFEGATASEWPSRAAVIAKYIFEHRDAGVAPEAMSALFFLLGSNDFAGSVGFNSAYLSEAQIDKLIDLAFERGNVFSEAFNAITYYCLDILSLNSGAPRNCHLWADLIFETIDRYDSLLISKLISNRTSLYDGIRLAAQEVKIKHTV